MEMDEKWTCFAISYDFDVFCQESIPEIKLKPEVHEDVHAKFRIVRKLLEHSFYEYEFYDAAELIALLTFEMALKIRYREITETEWGTKPLEQIITWFNKRNYFEVDNNNFLKYIREVRNDAAHPVKHNFAGPLKRQMILYTIDLINDLYEEPTLRVERDKIRQELFEIIKKLSSKGLRISFNETTRLAFVAHVVFVNNKKLPMEIYLHFRPIYYIPEILEPGKLYDSPEYIITASEFGFKDNVLTLIDSELTQYRISTIVDESDLAEFNQWAARFQKYNQHTFEIASINSNFTSSFSKHLRAFHFS